MKIALGCDHRGREAINHLADVLRRDGHEVEVFQDADATVSDYPVAAYQVATRVASNHADRGVLICGTGIGMSIAANKVNGVRAAAVHDEITAEVSRSHNDANVCCLSADLLGLRLIEKIVNTWLGTEFEGGRHARRIERIKAIEQGHNPANEPADTPPDH